MGRVHSFQSLGTLDGPGVRFVVFTQGCPLRCGCCHNPDTWDMKEGSEFAPEEVVAKAVRYKEYFKKDGGITISGGEPLLQPEFVREVFSLCHKEGINTCLDTSGCILNEGVKAALEETDRVLLDIKYTDELSYEKYVGCEMKKVTEFLSYLDEKKIPVTLRQVIIPTLNDNAENIGRLRKIAQNHSCVDKTELLPFRKICQVKYDKMGIDFPFDNIPEPDKELMEKLNRSLKDENFSA